MSMQRLMILKTLQAIQLEEKRYQIHMSVGRSLMEILWREEVMWWKLLELFLPPKISATCSLHLVPFPPFINRERMADWELVIRDTPDRQCSLQRPWVQKAQISLPLMELFGVWCEGNLIGEALSLQGQRWDWAWEECWRCIRTSRCHAKLCCWWSESSHQLIFLV